MMKSLISLFATVILLSATSCKEKNNATTTPVDAPARDLKFSLAQWSFHKELFDGSMDNHEFIRKAKDMGFTGVEFVSQFFQDKVENKPFLDSLKATLATTDMTPVMIMVDHAGSLASTDESERTESVTQHKKWINACKHLGCMHARVNLWGTDSRAAQQQAAITSLTELGNYAQQLGINVIVENHGQLSSDADYLVAVMQGVNMENVGMLPDLGNWCIEREGGEKWGTPCIKEYDRYDGTKKLMPYAKGVSLKSHDFDEDGNEVNTDYYKIAKIIKDSGFEGYYGVEYEGEHTAPEKGIILTKTLAEKVLR